MHDIESLQKIVNHLSQAEKDVETSHNLACSSDKKTRRIISLMLIIIGFFALINLYYVNDLSQEVKVIMRAMNKMYFQFGQMSERVSGMREHVNNMDDNIALMPVMVEQMGEMSGNMDNMQRVVAGMRGNMSNMGPRVTSMNRDIGTMSILFRDVNGKVRHMGYNVSQMSRVVP